MSQDNPNDQVNSEEPQVAATVPDDRGHLEELAQPAHTTDLGEDAFTEDLQVGEDANDATTPVTAKTALVDEAESDEEDSTDETDASTTASTLADMLTTQSSPAPTANTEDTQADDRCEIEKQPYDFDHCTVQIAIQLLPDDGDPNGRMVVLGARSHLDSPILRFIHLNELGTLPPVINTLLDQLKSELPSREQSALAAFEKKKQEKAKRKSLATAPKTSARGKKTKATTVSTAPTSNANVTDNRPRPEVRATTTPQQQMGLL